MNRDHPQHRHHRDASRFDEPERYSENRPSRYAHSSRHEDVGSWNEEQTARWLSRYGGATQRNERDYDPTRIRHVAQLGQ